MPDDAAAGRASAWATFRADLGTSLAAWSSEPRLPLWTLVLALAIEIPTAVGQHSGLRGLALVALPFELVLAGWSGTQRIWYLRAFRGRTIGAGEAGRFTWAFLGPFFVLGLLVGAVVGALSLILGVVGGMTGTRVVARSTGFVVYLTIVIVLMDVFLTFVTPALAYSTDSATKAIGLGWRLLRQDWPRCAWYALMPPLALVLVTRSLPRSSLSVVPAAIIGTLAWMLNLCFKGATAAYYLRGHDVGDDGSARFR